jgi:light-regulated signal transduction histidine kinase (bacteriophytochrome)
VATKAKTAKEVKEVREESVPMEVIGTQALLSGLTELSARAGHDMVGPLNQVGSLLTLFFRRHQEKVDSDAEQLLDFLKSASVRMEAVVNGMRRYMEAVSALPVCAHVDLNQLVVLVLDRLQPEITKSGAMIHSDPLPPAWADSVQIALVFENLIGNAIKFGKLDETARIHISGGHIADMLAVTVRDEGIGIDAEQSENIFLPFRRLNGSEYPGAGLGLATVKTIIGMHGGTVSLVSESAGSAGTCMQFTLRSA